MALMSNEASLWEQNNASISVPIMYVTNGQLLRKLKIKDRKLDCWKTKISAVQDKIVFIEVCMYNHDMNGR